MCLILLLLIFAVSIITKILAENDTDPTTIALFGAASLLLLILVVVEMLP